MKNKKIPIRSCIVSKERLPKKDLIRIVRSPSGEVLVDLSGKINGRGAYIKKDRDVLDKARGSKILDKALGVEIPDSLYIYIYNMIN